MRGSRDGYAVDEVLQPKDEQVMIACSVEISQFFLLPRFDSLQAALGESVGAFRSVHLGDSYTQAYSLGAECQGAGFIEYFSGFGFFEAYRFPGETTPVPNTFERMVESKYALVGTTDDIKRELEALQKNSNVEWFGWFFDQGLMPWDETRRQLETFGKEVLPAFKD